ncbi:MAG: DUF1385 domain-containing protein [Ruminococcaceae bacterium]|nr:DUF1385 domain-containing protein [Oscillospiraceae bacterium]
MSNKEQTQSCRLGSVGGQAIIEGVMMRSKKHSAIAVRRMDNHKIAVSRKVNTSVSDKFKFLKWPLIRGVVNFVESLIQSFATLTQGTEMLGIDYEAETSSKFDKWLEEHCGKWLVGIISAISMVLGVLLALVLFIWLPTAVTNLFFGRYAVGFGAGVLRSALEGVLKVVIFIAYIWLTAFIPDMKRVYMYHGAEHKSIFCYEKGLELTVENVKAQSRFHPRCGTSFMFAMILLSIFVGIAFLWAVEAVWLRTVLKLALLPLTVGVGYEFIRYAGKHDSKAVQILSKPGLWMQNLTTREPDDEIIEVGITALKCALPDEFEGFYEECLAALEADEKAENDGAEETANTENSEESAETTTPAEDSFEA